MRGLDKILQVGKTYTFLQSGEGFYEYIDYEIIGTTDLFLRVNIKEVRTTDGYRNTTPSHYVFNEHYKPPPEGGLSWGAIYGVKIRNVNMHIRKQVNLYLSKELNLIISHPFYVELMDVE